jgi:hypothetical protein
VPASTYAVLTAHEIRLEAEKLLGSAISRHSIAYQLRTRSKGSDATVIQTGRRYYRLAESCPPEALRDLGRGAREPQSRTPTRAGASAHKPGLIDSGRDHGDRRGRAKHY